MPLFPVDPPRPPAKNKVTVYHAQPYGNRDPLRRLVEPDLFVDTSSVLDRKVELLACHVSQKTWLDESQGIDSYLDNLRRLDAEVGRMSGLFPYAEGWAGTCTWACATSPTIRCARLRGKVLAA